MTPTPPTTGSGPAPGRGAVTGAVPQPERATPPASGDAEQTPARTVSHPASDKPTAAVPQAASVPLPTTGGTEPTLVRTVSGPASGKATAARDAVPQAVSVPLPTTGGTEPTPVRTVSHPASGRGAATGAVPQTAGGTPPPTTLTGARTSGTTPRSGPRPPTATTTGTARDDAPGPAPRPGVVRRVRLGVTRLPAPGGTPSLPRLILEDLQAVLDRDPSCSGRLEALLHAGWQGLALHRLAHRRYRRGHRLRAAVLTRLARLLTGMEIHAGASIGRRAFIDHGFGVVIGETAVIGDDVTLYHGVTLGSRGWLRDSDGGRRRHPVLGDNVLIGTGASVLGPVTVGDGCRIAAHSLVLHDLPAAGTPTRRAHPR
jgi:serine O-acetyltransferase